MQKYYILDTSAITYALEDYGYSLMAGANRQIEHELRQWKKKEKKYVAKYIPRPERIHYVENLDEALDYAKGKIRVGQLLERRHVSEALTRLIITQCLQGLAKCIVPRSIDKEIQEIPYGILYDEITEYIKLKNHDIISVVDDPKIPYEAVEIYKREGLSEQDIMLLYLAEAMKKKGYNVVLVTGDKKLYEIASRRGIKTVWLFSRQLQEIASKLKAVASRIFKLRRNSKITILV